MTQDTPDVTASIAKLANSGLLDQEWYTSTYADQLGEEADPLAHFCRVGWLQGLKPNFYFDTNGYLQEQEDIRKAGVNPLVHYLEYGEPEGRKPSEHFDQIWYSRTYGSPGDVCCLADYLRRCKQERISPNGGFDAAWYAREYPDAVADNADLFITYAAGGMAAQHDSSEVARIIRHSGLFDFTYYAWAYPHVAAAGLDPIYHYCNRGWRYERCNPNPMFDTDWYLKTYEDLRSADMNPLYHYLAFGETENRRPSPNFEPAVYRRGHEVPEHTSCLAHYLQHRPRPPVAQAGETAEDDPQADPTAEPRPLFVAPPRTHRETVPGAAVIEDSELFDINYYLINYPDVRGSELEPLEHFCLYGWQEGRRANPYFDSAWYLKTYLNPNEPQNPLLHYITFGERAGNRPIVYFDPAWYRARYKLAAEDSPLRHYLENRRTQRYSPLKLFDVDRYMAAFGPEIGPNRDPFAHYLRVGIYRDIDPGPDFDAKQYRAVHMDAPPSKARPVPGAEIHEKLRREPLNPLVHYLLNEFRVHSAAVATPEGLHAATG